MQVSLAGTGVWLSDGATNIMPVARTAPRRRLARCGAEGGEPRTRPPRVAAPLRPRPPLARRTASTRAGTCTRRSCRRATPPSTPSSSKASAPASERLRNFVEKAAQATLVGDVFDDAATGQGLLNYFLRGINCGAITEDGGTRLSGLTTDELRSGSFVRILKNRRQI